MKIIFQHNVTNCGPWFLRQGYAKVFQAAGHLVFHWYSEQKSAYDYFDEIGTKFDLFVGQTYTLSRSLIEILKQSNAKVILQCSTWGPITDTLDLNKYPILVPSEQEKIYVRQLHEAIGDRLGFVFLNYHENKLEETLSYWNTKLDLNILGSPCAADTFSYLGGEFKPEYESDICFVGGNWGYKGQNLNKYLVPLCNENTAPIINGKKIKVKIWGQGWQGLPQYLGPIEEQEVKHVFASAKICLNVSEPHSQALGFDIVERPFKTALSGNVVLSDYVASMDDDVFGNTVMYYHDYQSLATKIKLILNSRDNFKNGWGQAAKRLVLKEHTYFDRVYDMLKYLSHQDEADKILIKKQELLNV